MQLGHRVQIPRYVPLDLLSAANYLNGNADILDAGRFVALLSFFLLANVGQTSFPRIA
jgi:hypothetical protein